MGKKKANPTGRKRKSSSGTRRKKQRREDKQLEEDLKGTKWEKKNG